MAPVETVLSDIAVAASNVRAAESALETGQAPTARSLHLRAEEHLTAILRKICDLTEQEADHVEPRFTEFEEHLIRLGNALLPPEDVVFQ